jgi:cyclic-di-GMP phosphodiesterase TipF (flagellum assembly factor)
MLRLGAVFIVLCMALIAASIGAALYLLVGLKASESLIVAVAVLTGLAIYNAVTSDCATAPTSAPDRRPVPRHRRPRPPGGRTRPPDRGAGGQGDKIIDGAAEKARAATRRSPASWPSSAPW